MSLMNLLIEIVVSFACLATLTTGFRTSCVKRDYGQGSVVCVCDEKACHNLGNVSKPASGTAVIYKTTKDGLRFESQTLPFVESKEKADFIIQPSLLFEAGNRSSSIVGFGGAFTDASGINIASLPSPLQTKILQTYFSPEGLDYTVARIPMASCDFSTRIYTYDDVYNDFALQNFRLAAEDIEYKIPFIRMAKQMQPQDIFFYGSPWSAPGWLKTTNSTIGGTLIGQAGNKYHKTWAQYFVKYLKTYEKYGIKHWGLTVENEPNEGFIINYPFQNMAFTASMERDFIKTDLGPALDNAGYGHINLMILDDNRTWLEHFAVVILSDPEAARFVSGIGTHWYADAGTPPTVIDRVRAKFPNQFILATEACAGWAHDDTPHASLGNWHRAEQYAHSIMENLQHSVVGWVDWNLVLDLQGGPNWVNNFADAPIIVNITANEFYLQPTYYAMAHYSKFITRGSRLLFSRNVNQLEVVGYLRPDNGVVIVVFNGGDTEDAYGIHDQRLGYLANTIEPHSIQTILYY